jgi:hypothetical protein
MMFKNLLSNPASLTTMIGCGGAIAIGLSDQWVFGGSLVKNGPVSDLGLVLVGIGGLLSHNPLPVPGV